MGKTVDEAVTQMLHIEDEVGGTLDKLGLANHKWLDCLEELQNMNRRVRVVGRRLDNRKNQAEEHSQEINTLIVKYGGRVKNDMGTKRIAIDGLMSQQKETLNEVHEHIVELNDGLIDCDGKANDFQDGLEKLNETICTIEKPISHLEEIQPNIPRMGAKPAEFKRTVRNQLQYLTMVERLTLHREIMYGRGIFFDAIKSNNGEITEPLFNQLILRLPNSLGEAFKSSSKTFKQYRVVISGSIRNKLGPMNETTVKTFLNDLENDAFEMMKERSKKFDARYGYIREEVEGATEDFTESTIVDNEEEAPVMIH